MVIFNIKLWLKIKQSPTCFLSGFLSCPFGIINNLFYIYQNANFHYSLYKAVYIFVFHSIEMLFITHGMDIAQVFPQWKNVISISFAFKFGILGVK